MPTATTIRPDGVRTLAWQGFLDLVRPYLIANGVKVVWAPDGTPNQSGDLPLLAGGAVRFTPSSPTWQAIASRRNTVRGIRCNVDVVIETRVQGTNWCNSANLLELIEAALGSGRGDAERETIWTRLRAAHVTDWEILTAPETAEENGTAKGLLRLHVGKTV